MPRALIRVVRRLVCFAIGHATREVGMLTIEGQAIPLLECDRCGAPAPWA